MDATEGPSGSASTISASSAPAGVVDVAVSAAGWCGDDPRWWGGLGGGGADLPAHGAALGTAALAVAAGGWLAPTWPAKSAAQRANSSCRRSSPACSAASAARRSQRKASRWSPLAQRADAVSSASSTSSVSAETGPGILVESLSTILPLLGDSGQRVLKCSRSRRAIGLYGSSAKALFSICRAVAFRLLLCWIHANWA